MKVKIPRKIKIGATPVFILRKQYLQGDEGFHGTFNRRTGELEIDSSLDGAIRDKSFAHEIMEVIKESYNLHTPEDDMSNIGNGWIEFLWQLGIEFDWGNIK